MGSFEDKLALGRNYEKALADWLNVHGWYVLPVYDYSGGEDDEKKAPKLGAAPGVISLVMPDLMAARAGKAIFVECKFKGEATRRNSTCGKCGAGVLVVNDVQPNLCRKCGRSLIETGFSRRLYYHYALVSMEAGIDAWVAFVHRKEGEVRAAPFSKLEANARFYRGGGMGRHGMAFFEWDALEPVVTYAQLMGEPDLPKGNGKANGAAAGQSELPIF